MTEKIDKLKIEYDSQSGLAQQFSTEMVRQIETLIAQKGIRLGFPIQSRVKSWDSITEKINRNILKLQSLSSLQDLVGLRVTLTFLRDVNVIKSLIEETFEIIKTYNTSERLSPNEFGYNSIHIVVKCPESWNSVPSLSHLSGFHAEIQVRTLAQHIWAEVSHQLQYKNEENVPDEVQRAISRSSALLETIDLEFERVLERRDEYKSEIRGAQILNDMQINSDNLDVLFEEIMPKENKVEGEKYSELINDCKQLNISKISDLRRIVETHRNAMLRREDEQVRRMLGNSLCDEEFHKKIEGASVFYSFVGLARQALIEEFGEKLIHKIMSQSLLHR